MIAGPAGVAFAPGDNGSLGQDDRRRQDLDARERLDLRGRLRRLVPDGDRRLRARQRRRAVPHRRRRRHVARARHRQHRAPARRATRSSAKTVLVVGPTGLRRSTDAGDTFSAVQAARATPRSSARSTRRPGRVFAYGVQDVWRSTDKGKTWTAVQKPGKYVKQRNGKKVNRRGVSRVDFVSAKTGYLLDTNGTLYRTTERRQEVERRCSASARTPATGMAFSSANNGYLIIELVRAEGRRRLPAAHDRRRQDVGAGVRRAEHHRRARRGGRGRRHGLPARRGLEPAVQHHRRAGGRAARRSASRRSTKTFKKAPKTSITVTGTLKPTTASRRSTRSSSATWPRTPRSGARRPSRSRPTARSRRAGACRRAPTRSSPSGRGTSRAPAAGRPADRHRQEVSGPPSGGECGLQRRSRRSPPGAPSPAARRAVRSSACGGCRARSPAAARAGGVARIVLAMIADLRLAEAHAQAGARAAAERDVGDPCAAAPCAPRAEAQRVEAVAGRPRRRAGGGWPTSSSARGSRRGPCGRAARTARRRGAGRCRRPGTSAASRRGSSRSRCADPRATSGLRASS